jgi:hypothetical protein
LARALTGNSTGPPIRSRFSRFETCAAGRCRLDRRQRPFFCWTPASVVSTLNRTLPERVPA